MAKLRMSVPGRDLPAAGESGWAGLQPFRARAGDLGRCFFLRVQALDFDAVQSLAASGRKRLDRFSRHIQLPRPPSVTYWSKILTHYSHIRVDCNPTRNLTRLPLSTCLFFGVTYEIITLLILLNILFLKLRNWQG